MKNKQMNLDRVKDPFTRLFLQFVDSKDGPSVVGRIIGKKPAIFYNLASGRSKRPDRETCDIMATHFPDYEAKVMAFRLGGVAPPLLLPMPALHPYEQPPPDFKAIISAKDEVIAAKEATIDAQKVTIQQMQDQIHFVTLRNDILQKQVERYEQGTQGWEGKDMPNAAPALMPAYKRVVQKTIGFEIQKQKRSVALKPRPNLPLRRDRMFSGFSDLMNWEWGNMFVSESGDNEP